jgi:hypothetical protein
LIETWDGNSWTVTPTPSKGTQAYLRGVSCASANSCVAAGTYDNGTVDQTLIEAWNGTAWSIVASPNDGTADNSLTGVSCAASNACVASGAFTGGSVSHTLIESWKGSKWSIVSSPDKGASDNALNGVSCASATNCETIGSAEIGTQSEALVESFNGKKWSVTPTPDPGGTGSSEFNAVSCAGSSTCAAVGDFFPESIDQTLAETWNGSIWSIKWSANFGPFSNMLDSIWCVTSTQCVAVGGYSTSESGADQTLVQNWDGARWSITSNLREFDKLRCGRGE